VSTPATIIFIFVAGLRLIDYTVQHCGTHLFTFFLFNDYLVPNFIVLFLRAGRDETEISTSETDGLLSGRQPSLQSRRLFVESRRDQTSKREGGGNTAEDRPRGLGVYRSSLGLLYRYRRNGR